MNYFIQVRREIFPEKLSLKSKQITRSLETGIWVNDVWGSTTDTKLGKTSTPIHARAWKEKALAGYNSQQIPTKNDIHKMLIIIISLRWKHFVIKSYLYKIPTNTHRYSHSLISPTGGSQLSFILSLKNCIRRTNIYTYTSLLKSFLTCHWYILGTTKVK